MLTYVARPKIMRIIFAKNVYKDSMSLNTYLTNRYYKLSTRTGVMAIAKTF